MKIMKKTLMYGIIVMAITMSATFTVNATKGSQINIEARPISGTEIKQLYTLMRADPQKYRLYIDLYGKYLVTGPIDVQAFMNLLDDQ